jgi:hypothetical protein
MKYKKLFKTLSEQLFLVCFYLENFESDPPQAENLASEILSYVQNPV